MLQDRNPIIASRTLDLRLLLGWLSAWNALKLGYAWLRYTQNHPDKLLTLSLTFSRFAAWPVQVDPLLGHESVPVHCAKAWVATQLARWALWASERCQDTARID